MMAGQLGRDWRDNKEGQRPFPLQTLLEPLGGNSNAEELLGVGCQADSYALTRELHVHELLVLRNMQVAAIRRLREEYLNKLRVSYALIHTAGPSQTALERSLENINERFMADYATLRAAHIGDFIKLRQKQDKVVRGLQGWRPTWSGTLSKVGSQLCHVELLCLDDWTFESIPEMQVTGRVDYKDLVPCVRGVQTLRRGIIRHLFPAFEMEIKRSSKSYHPSMRTAFVDLVAYFVKRERAGQVKLVDGNTYLLPGKMKDDERFAPMFRDVPQILGDDYFLAIFIPRRRGESSLLTTRPATPAAPLNAPEEHRKEANVSSWETERDASSSPPKRLIHSPVMMGRESDLIDSATLPSSVSFSRSSSSFSSSSSSSSFSTDASTAPIPKASATPTVNTNAKTSAALTTALASFPSSSSSGRASLEAAKESTPSSSTALPKSFFSATNPSSLPHSRLSDPSQQKALPLSDLMPMPRQSLLETPSAVMSLKAAASFPSSSSSSTTASSSSCSPSSSSSCSSSSAAITHSGHPLSPPSSDTAPAENAAVNGSATAKSTLVDVNAAKEPSTSTSSTYDAVDQEGSLKRKKEVAHIEIVSSGSDDEETRQQHRTLIASNFTRKKLAMDTEGQKTSPGVKFAHLPEGKHVINSSNYPGHSAATLSGSTTAGLTKSPRMQYANTEQKSDSSRPSSSLSTSTADNDGAVNVGNDSVGSQDAAGMSFARGNDRLTNESQAKERRLRAEDYM